MAHARKLRFGVQIGSAGSRKDWLDKLAKAEALGYSTVSMPDHFGDQLAPVPALAVAAESSNLRIGTLVLDNDYKHPVVLAKEAATLDLLSEGRLELGVGAGWMRTDYEQSGIAYDPPAVRIDRFEEGLEILKRAFGPEAFSFEGKHYRISDYNGLPKPAQDPHPPILIGAGGKRMLQIAAREADIVGVNPNLRAGEITMDAGRDSTAQRMDRKIGWIREAAGDRFEDLELNVLVFMAVVTDDRMGRAASIAPMFGLEAEEALEVPSAFVGSIDQMCEDVLARRERWGVSYYTISEGAMEAFAPVVERLAGR